MEFFFLFTRTSRPISPMPNFEENASTVSPSTTHVSTTYSDSAKSTKSDAVNEENAFDKITPDETKDENKRQERNSLQREVSVDALSSKTFKNVSMLYVGSVTDRYRFLL